MKSNNVVQEKSYAFALWIVKLYCYLCEEKKEFVLSKQIVRSGTSMPGLINAICIRPAEPPSWIDYRKIADEYWLGSSDVGAI